MRSTEGQFPYWLGVDDRLIADEFFRGSYTSGIWLKGELHAKVKYQVMFANNLSTLGVSAAQLDNRLNTQSYSVQWMPTTGEFGLWNTFGEYDDHQKVATRIGVHYSHRLEDKSRRRPPAESAFEEFGLPAKGLQPTKDSPRSPRLRRRERMGEMERIVLLSRRFTTKRNTVSRMSPRLRENRKLSQKVSPTATTKVGLFWSGFNT